MNPPHAIARRTALGIGAGLAAGAVLPNGASAAAPRVGLRPPAWHRFEVGGFECTVVSDGTIPLRALADFPGAPANEVRALMEESFLPLETTIEQNALVVNTGRQLVLIDTGMGRGTFFGPTTGRFMDNFRAAGFQPEQVDAVLCTHAHPDHCWGVTTADGQPVFPNAQLYLNEADVRFWTDERLMASPGVLAEFVRGTRDQLLPLRDRLRPLVDAREAVPGIRAVATPGHTVGHTSFVVTSGADSLFVAGDIAHHFVLLLRKPRWHFVADTDPAQAAETRVRTLDMLATERMGVLAFHFPFPGLGNVGRVGDGYAFVPRSLRA